MVSASEEKWKRRSTPCTGYIDSLVVSTGCVWYQPRRYRGIRQSLLHIGCFVPSYTSPTSPQLTPDIHPPGIHPHRCLWPCAPLYLIRLIIRYRRSWRDRLLVRLSRRKACCGCLCSVSATLELFFVYLRPILGVIPLNRRASCVLVTY